ncbi:MAG: hypothetical protein GX860_09975, partial [Alcaligenaceae bacterium]|nr:hypothetical protein [Alcaligenaceae bacterium]
RYHHITYGVDQLENFANSKLHHQKLELALQIANLAKAASCLSADFIRVQNSLELKEKLNCLLESVDETQLREWHLGLKIAIHIDENPDRYFNNFIERLLHFYLVQDFLNAITIAAIRISRRDDISLSMAQVLLEITDEHKRLLSLKVTLAKVLIIIGLRYEDEDQKKCHKYLNRARELCVIVEKQCLENGIDSVFISKDGLFEFYCTYAYLNWIYRERGEEFVRKAVSSFLKAEHMCEEFNFDDSYRSDDWAQDIKMLIEDYIKFHKEGDHEQ